jgi:hypothetical protein
MTPLRKIHTKPQKKTLKKQLEKSQKTLKKQKKKLEKLSINP